MRECACRVCRKPNRRDKFGIMAHHTARRYVGVAADCTWLTSKDNHIDARANGLCIAARRIVCPHRQRGSRRRWPRWRRDRTPEQRVAGVSAPDDAVRGVTAASTSSHSPCPHGSPTASPNCFARWWTGSICRHRLPRSDDLASCSSRSITVAHGQSRAKDSPQPALASASAASKPPASGSAERAVLETLVHPGEDCIDSLRRVYRPDDGAGSMGRLLPPMDGAAGGAKLAMALFILSPTLRRKWLTRSMRVDRRIKPNPVEHDHHMVPVRTPKRSPKESVTANGPRHRSLRCHRIGERDPIKTANSRAIRRSRRPQVRLHHGSCETS